MLCFLALVLSVCVDLTMVQARVTPNTELTHNYHSDHSPMEMGERKRERTREQARGIAILNTVKVEARVVVHDDHWSDRSVHFYTHIAKKTLPLTFSFSSFSLSLSWKRHWRLLKTLPPQAHTLPLNSGFFFFLFSCSSLSLSLSLSLFLACLEWDLYDSRRGRDSVRTLSYSLSLSLI